MKVQEGTVVRDRKWGGRFRGTVVRREGDSVFVAWHSSFVEDELSIAEVEPVADSTPEEEAWRGGIGLARANGEFTIEPTGRS